MRLPSGRERTVCDTPNGVVFRTMDSAADAERCENSAGPVVAALPNPPCGVGHDGTFGDTMFLRAVAASNAQEGMMRVMLAATRKEPLLLWRRSRAELGVGLWGLLWVLCIKMAANGEQSCCQRVFGHRP
jgi:hypothetical protein